MRKICTTCKKEKEINEFVKEKRSRNGYGAICKNCVNDKVKVWAKNNKIHRKIYMNKYYKNNKNELYKKQKEYNKIYEKVNRIKINKRKNNNLLKFAKYNTYFDTLIKYDKVKLDSLSKVYLKIKCTHCNKWFIPTNSKVIQRVNSIKNKEYDKCKFYCIDCYDIGYNLFNKNTTNKLTLFYINKKILTIAPGYKLESTKYINATSKLKFTCPEGHKFKMGWNHFQNGQRCPEHWKRNYTKKELVELKNYRAYVTQLSNINFRKYYYRINSNKLKRGRYKYQLDHIYSVMEGFRNNIPVKVISNPNNLQMLWWSDNISKFDKSGSTKQELYLGYYKYNLMEIT